MTLKELCTQHLEIYKKPFIKIGTYERYKCAIKHIPNTDIKWLCSEDIQVIINELYYKGYSSTTLRHVKIILLQALKRAQKLQLIKPIDLTVEMPKQRKTKIQALSESDQELIINNSYKSYYGDFFKSLLYTGCRVGELIALTWDDVDFRNNTISINKTDWRGHIHSPKTEESVRLVPMSQALRDLLLSMYRLGSKGTVYKNSIGTAINYRSLLEAWHRYLNVLCLKPIGLHVLRHTFATNALRAGVNYKYLSKILGHASVAITMDIYTDVTEEDKQTAINMLDDFLKRSKAVRVPLTGRESSGKGTLIGL